MIVCDCFTQYLGLKKLKEADDGVYLALKRIEYLSVATSTTVYAVATVNMSCASKLDTLGK